MKKYTLLIAALMLIITVITAKAEHDHNGQSFTVRVKSNDHKGIESFYIDGKKVDLQILKAFIEKYRGSKDSEEKKYVLKVDDHVDKALKKAIRKQQYEGLSEQDQKRFEVFIDHNVDEEAEKVVVNGKMLSTQEINDFKLNGKMNVWHLDEEGEGKHDKKVVFMSTDGDIDIDVDLIVDEVLELDKVLGKEVLVKSIKHNDKASQSVYKKHMQLKYNNDASLGFVTNVKKDGWHLLEVIENSGAAEAGIRVGDVLKSIAGIELAGWVSNEDFDVDALSSFDDGEIIEVVLERNGQTIIADVEARQINDQELSFDLSSDDSQFEWSTTSNHDDLLSDIRVMLFDGEEDDFRLLQSDIKMVFPKDLSDMSIFVSDGRSTSKLLGGSHEMSTLSEGLSHYFHTTGGVLVLHVDETNTFALQDGDVIKSVNDELVNSPKDVVKALLLAEEQESIELFVIRNKASMILKYQK